MRHPVLRSEVSLLRRAAVEHRGLPGAACICICWSVAAVCRAGVWKPWAAGFRDRKAIAARRKTATYGLHSLAMCAAHSDDGG